MFVRRGRFALLASAVAGAALYAVSRVVLLNNGTAMLFPRELEALLLGLFGMTITLAFLRPRRLAVTGAAALSLAGFLFLSLPVLGGPRLVMMHSAIPIAPREDVTLRSTRCFCGTRASLHELFGPPDYVTSGRAELAETYAYRLSGDASSARVVIYRLETGQTAFDRITGSDLRENLSEAQLRVEGLGRWGTR